jgi:glutamate racemase
MNIGFFDSGNGAYFIADYFNKKFPKYNISILTDPKNIPYGNKNNSELLVLLEKHVRSLFNDNSELVIIACNTLSTTHLKYIQDTLITNEFPDRRVLGVAIPTIEAIIDSSYKSFLILATENTVHSKYFERKICGLNPEKIIISRAVPKLASVIEQENYSEAKDIMMQVIENVTDSYEVIVLACTHYTILKDFLRNKYPNIKIFSQDEIVADKLELYLQRHDDIKRLVEKGK